MADEPTEHGMTETEPRTMEPSEAARGVIDDIKRQIQQATTVDELLASPDLQSLEEAELVDVPVRIMAFEPRAGDFGPYAVIDLAVQETGEVMRITCGGEIVLTQLAKARIQGWLPMDCKVIMRQTRQGFRTFRLVAKDQ